MLTLSGSQPYNPQTMKIPERRGNDRLTDVDKQTTDELKDRLSGKGFTFSKDGDVNVVKVKGDTKIARALKLLDAYEYLEGRDLFDKTTPYSKAAEIGEKYYKETLTPSEIQSPAFSGQYVSFTEAGFDHVMGKHRADYTEDSIKRRLSLLPRVLPILQSTPYVDEVRAREDGTKEYGLLGKFSDGRVVRVVVEESKQNNKTFLYVFVS